MTNLAVVTTFNTRVEAEIAQGALKANNIEPVIQADDEGGMAPFPFKPSAGGVSILVSKKDFKKAKLILKNSSC